MCLMGRPEGPGEEGEEEGPPDARDSAVTTRGDGVGGASA